MKMKPKDYTILKAAIDDVLEKYNYDGQLEREYAAGNYARSDKTKDVQRRFCSDILFGAGISSWVSKSLYSYLDDDHIYTALKTMCPTISKEG
tara:strand:+ start:249 stop:527 length:279 start_codon:yes stop_codon:yes gene_type:complete